MVDPEDTITPDMLESADTDPSPQAERVFQLQTIFNAIVDASGKAGMREFEIARNKLDEAVMWLKRGLDG